MARPRLRPDLDAVKRPTTVPNTLCWMSGAWLARLRWRRRGAWLWPTFVVLIIVDAVVGHALPPAGDSQAFFGALLIALFLNLIAVLLLSRPLGAVVRRYRPDMPKMVARDYGGRVAILLVAVGIITAGLLHRPTIIEHRRAMQDAISRAQAWIGDRAPAEFRRNVEFVSTLAIEPGRIYRTCVPSDRRPRTYCVIVNTQLPLATSVKFAGYEPNSVFSEGIG
jgi:hypothetical protein